jgi:hypothetical protein
VGAASGRSCVVSLWRLRRSWAAAIFVKTSRAVTTLRTFGMSLPNGSSNRRLANVMARLPCKLATPTTSLAKISRSCRGSSRGGGAAGFGAVVMGAVPLRPDTTHRALPETSNIQKTRQGRPHPAPGAGQERAAKRAVPSLARQSCPADASHRRRPLFGSLVRFFEGGRCWVAPSGSTAWGGPAVNPLTLLCCCRIGWRNFGA